MTRQGQYVCHDCGHSIDDDRVTTIPGGRDFDDAFTHEARKWVDGNLTTVHHPVLRRKAVAS